MNLRGAVIAGALALVAGCANDPYASMSCGELRDIAENSVTQALNADAPDDEVLQAIEDKDRAQDRMAELGCFER